MCQIMGTLTHDMQTRTQNTGNNQNNLQSLPLSLSPSICITTGSHLMFKKKPFTALKHDLKTLSRCNLLKKSFVQLASNRATLEALLFNVLSTNQGMLTCYQNSKS